MRVTPRRTYLVILLVGLFLAAQFHYCADLTPTASASHMCPVCSTISSAVAAHSPSIAIIPLANRLEIVPPVLTVSSAIQRASSPRAPPAL